MRENLLIFVVRRDKEMVFLQDAVLVVHVLAALTIIGMVMLQRGKGAEMGAGFGSGSSTTVFGSAGSGNFLTKFTSFAAVLFFLTSFSLAYFARQRSEIARDLGIPTVDLVEQTQPGELSLPELNMEADSSTGEFLQSEAPISLDEGGPEAPTVDPEVPTVE